MWNTSVACTYTSEIIIVMFSHSTDCFSSSWLGLSANTGWRIITVKWLFSSFWLQKFHSGFLEVWPLWVPSNCIVVAQVYVLLPDCCLACMACMPHGLYVLLALISFFIFQIILWAQDLLDQLSPNFHRMVGIQSKITYLTLFFR